MTKTLNSKQYELEARPFEFAKKASVFVNKLPNSISNTEDIRQFVKASGPAGANNIVIV